MQTKLPAGGPLKVSPNVAALFLAQIEVIASADDEARQERAVRRRNAIKRKLGKRQRELVKLVGGAAASLVSPTD